MKGYCSNSPLRCSIAFSCEVVESENNTCPKCLKALILVDTKIENIEKARINIRRAILLVGIIILIIIPYLLFFQLLNVSL